jgi:quinol-cytochrome oxidoreductase complex cytochrome b subunit
MSFVLSPLDNNHLDYSIPNALLVVMIVIIALEITMIFPWLAQQTQAAHLQRPLRV